MHKYRVVWAEDNPEIAKAVTALLNRGWKCQGGVSLTVFTNENDVRVNVFHQAMVKEDINEYLCVARARANAQ